MKTPGAEKKLAQARLSLDRIQVENRRAIGKNLFAIETDVAACLGFGKAAFYRLRREAGKITFTQKKKEWMERQTGEDCTFFYWMLRQRDLDVHEKDPETTVKEGAIPAHLVPGVQVFAPPGALVPNPVPGGSPASAPGWVHTQEVHLGPDEAARTCAKFLDLLDSLIREFQDITP